jgi:hypothetical protein
MGHHGMVTVSFLRSFAASSWAAAKASVTPGGMAALRSGPAVHAIHGSNAAKKTHSCNKDNPRKNFETLRKGHHELPGTFWDQG